MTNIFLIPLLGLLSGTFLTLMDRIDEHRIVERHRTILAYLATIATAASMAWSIKQFPVLYRSGEEPCRLGTPCPTK